MTEPDLKVVLHDVLFWERAPNLISVAKLVEKGMKVTFGTAGAEVLTSSGRTVAVARPVDGIFKFQAASSRNIKYALVLANVWHHRLNHCGKTNLSKTVPDIPKKEIELLNKADCLGCVYGQAQRKPILYKTRNRSFTE